MCRGSFFGIRLRLLNDASGQELGNAPEETVIQRIGCIGVAMIVVVSKFRGISPHQSGDFLNPERGVIAARQHGKIFFQSQFHVQSQDRQVRNVGSSAAQHKIHGLGGAAIGEQAEKVADIADFDGQAGWHALGTGSGTGVADHLQNVGATDAEGCLWKKRFDEVAAAQETVFLAVERDKNHGQNRPPKAARRGATQHGGDGAAVVIRARAHGDGIVMSADEDGVRER